MSHEPIPPELWNRLRALDPRCEIAMVRTDPKRPSPWDGQLRVWIVTIRLYEDLVRGHLQHQHPTIVGALTAAIEDAEGRGWHKPSPQRPPAG